jgi:hypothetical protein
MLIFNTKWLIDCCKLKCTKRDNIKWWELKKWRIRMITIIELITNRRIRIRKSRLRRQHEIHVMLIIKCKKSDVSIIEDDVSDVTIWFSNRFEKINCRVFEIWNVIDFMFSFFDDSRQNFIMILNSFDLFKCSDIISVESNDLQHDVDFCAIKFEVMIDSNIVNITENSQIVSDFESKMIKLSSDSVLKFVMKNRS